ncbi:MAG: hypothetical protein AB8B80_16045 [Marinicellaceae bacterium]
MNKYILTAMVLICIFFFVLPEPDVEINKEKQLNKFNNIKQDHQTDNKFLVKPGIISDFNHSIKKTAFGTGIISTTDKMAGGKSIVKLSQVVRSDTNKALNVKGEVISGFMFPWSGISFIPVLEQNQAINMSQITSLNFDAKAI